jgi:hypothetical protein
LSRKLHIVALDVPFPPDYGAMIDVFYRLKALKSAGVEVTLHVYEYGRGEPEELKDAAAQVIYYKRPRSIFDVFSKLPFIVKSRRSETLLQNLLRDEDPIFFEGQHTCYFIDRPELRSRRKFVRVHNIEWQYYALLAGRTKSMAVRNFFRWESRKLKRFDEKLRYAEALFCVSHQDLDHYRQQHPNVILMPSASPFRIPENDAARGRYAIYHANLSVEENEEAALWIIEAFRTCTSSWPLIIAGKNPSERLRQACEGVCKLIENPDQERMTELIEKAGVQLLITFQNSGIKLKLINSLVGGGICIANKEMVNGTDLGQFCTIVSSQKELIDAIAEIGDLYPDTSERIEFMKRNYLPEETCKRVIEVLDRDV